MAKFTSFLFSNSKSKTDYVGQHKDEKTVRAKAILSYSADIISKNRTVLLIAKELYGTVIPQSRSVIYGEKKFTVFLCWPYNAVENRYDVSELSPQQQVPERKMNSSIR